ESISAAGTASSLSALPTARSSPPPALGRDTTFSTANDLAYLPRPASGVTSNFWRVHSLYVAMSAMLVKSLSRASVKSHGASFDSGPLAEYPHSHRAVTSRGTAAPSKATDRRISGDCLSQ